MKLHLGFVCVVLLFYRHQAVESQKCGTGTNYQCSRQGYYCVEYPKRVPNQWEQFRGRFGFACNQPEAYFPCTEQTTGRCKCKKGCWFQGKLLEKNTSIPCISLFFNSCFQYKCNSLYDVDLIDEPCFQLGYRTTAKPSG